MKRSAMRSRPRSTGPSSGVVDVVLGRDQHCCVCCGNPARGGRGVDWSVQHRVPRGAGGTRREWINLPSNLILLCGSATTGCHGRVESDRVWAREFGWSVSDGLALPSQVILLHAPFGRWVYLADDGSVSSTMPEVT